MALYDVEPMLSAWKEAYESLAKLGMEQLLLIKNASEENELWERMGKLSEKRISLQREIECLQSAIEGEIGLEAMKQIFRRDIQSSAETARVLTFETAHKIEHLMINVGTNLNAAKTHRRAFRAYTGWNSDDRVAFFFDEKK